VGRKLPDIETLKELHINQKMSCPKIAKLYNCSSAAVKNMFNKHHILITDHRVINLDTDALKGLYFDKKISFAKIASEYKIDPSTVREIFQRKRIKSRSLSEARSLHCHNLILTPEIIQFLNGLLLGDGCITYAPKKKSCVYAHTDKNRSYIRWLKRVLNELGISSGSIHSGARNCWRLDSLCYKAFIKIREEWYPNGKKRIPNLTITPIVLFNYFIGDGSTAWKKGKVNRIFIAEPDPEKNKIARQLEDLGIHNSVYKNYVYIRKSGQERFFQYICEIPYFIPKCYHYKFPKEFIFYNRVWALMEKSKSLSIKS